MQFEFSDKTLDKISSDSAVVFVFQREKDGKTFFTPLSGFKQLDALLNGQLTKVCGIEKFKGKRGEMLTVIPGVEILPVRVIVVGLGKKEEFVIDDLRRAVGSFAGRMRTKTDSVSMVVPDDLGIEDDIEMITQAVCEGLMLGSYVFNKYKDEKEDHKLASVIFSVQNSAEKKNYVDGMKKAELYAKATILARDLVNEPSSVGTPSFLAKLALDIAGSSPLVKCKIINKPELEKMGMDAFLSVAKGADTPPKFIHLEYTPAKNSSKKKLALVGKGITFDSGGVSLKPADSMNTMKCDMAGAAVVLGVFSVIAEVKPDFPVIGLIAATPNLVSGAATVPGDIVKALNGKTIEILNTDAEGRVTLADSLSYAVKEGATEIIDFATLTGACVVALGNDITGLFSNNHDLAEAVRSAGHDAGEKLWELPLEKDYKELNKSDVADIANIPSSRYGGTITAALFLQEFVNNKKWAHLDIAGPAFISKPNDLGPKGGTGFGVRTVLNLL